LDSSIVQGPFSVAPCQTLANITICNFFIAVRRITRRRLRPAVGKSAESVVGGLLPAALTRQRCGGRRRGVEPEDCTARLVHGGAPEWRHPDFLGVALLDDHRCGRARQLCCGAGCPSPVLALVHRQPMPCACPVLLPQTPSAELLASLCSGEPPLACLRPH
jgi:hypothetical protein